MNTPGERRQQALSSLNTIQLSRNPGWGERLLPYFLMAMEACWMDALLIAFVSLNLFQTRVTLLPLWAPFVFMAAAYWLTTYLERRAVTAAASEAVSHEHRAAGMVGAGWMFTLIAVLTLFVVWLSVYTAAGFFFDPRWLVALLNDILLLDGAAFHVAIMLALSVYLCWHGIRIARRVVEPADVFKGLRTGGVIFFVVMLVSMGTRPTAINEFLLVLLIPLFLAFALVAHALAQALFIRRSHTFGLQGSVEAQERSLLVISSGVGLVLVIVALAISALASPQSLTQLQQALAPVGAVYDLLVSWLAYAIVFLLTPLFWLLSSLHLRPQLPTIPQRPSPIKPGVHQTVPPPALVVASIPFIKLLIPLVFVVVLVFAVLAALRMRRVVLKPRTEEQHESLWSWHLFWVQLKAFFLALWHHFFPLRTAEVPHEVSQEAITAEPTARAVREIYRAFLRWAASHGYQRKKDETPYEFEARLDSQMPLIEMEVGVVTAAYNATRYGGEPLAEAEVQRVQQMWAELQDKASSE